MDHFDMVGVRGSSPLAPTPIATEEVGCPLCGGAEGAEGFRHRGALYRTLDGFFSAEVAYRVCRRDGLCFMSPRPTVDALRAYYARSVEPVFATNRLAHEERLAFLDGVAPLAPGTVLDIGSNDGTFLSLLLARGFRCVGVEPSRASADLCRLRLPAVDVLEAPFPEALSSLRPARYALVSLIHVLEHLPDPLDALRRVRALDLDVLFVEVPNLGAGLWPRIAKESGHLHFFTPATLGALLARAGFTGVIEEAPGAAVRAAVRPTSAPPAAHSGEEVEETLEALREAARRWEAYLAALPDACRRLFDRAPRGGGLAVFGAGTDAFRFLSLVGGEAFEAVIDSNPLWRGRLFCGRWPVLGNSAAERGIRAVVVPPSPGGSLAEAARRHTPAGLEIVAP